MPHTDADRNLLFGVLALQNNFIDRHALVAAFDRWVADKSRSLGQLLIDAGALTEQELSLLDALVARHLAKFGDDAQKSLAAVSSLTSVRGDLQGVADPDLQASLGHAAAAVVDEHDPWRTHAASTMPLPAVGMRFRILRPHAKGGLGEVFVALDEELHREVALKEIQGRHAHQTDSRTRFVLEAEITGGLEHPGIVPVYSLGYYADGRPYYAMRFIRGDSLQEAIERFHAADSLKKTSPGQRALESRKLLQRFVDVCNAMEYAHSRGVLHRDLKPGNIMLGKYGETLVVDWGLAKPLGRSEGAIEAPEPVLQPSSGSGSTPTQMGSAIGTPQFMSPEQAAGRLDQLCPASDVYSLGATLYCLLTGKPPFIDAQDAGLAEVLRRVQRGEFPTLRKLNKKLSASLEAVCLKAMALKPENRYSSPQELADEIEHWLADEPVAAYPEPLRIRVGRWVRRHRTFVTSAAVLLLTGVVTMSLAFVLLVLMANITIQAKDKAEAINKFLIEDLLASARPEEQGKDVSIRSVVDKAAKRVESSFAHQPEVEATVREALGETYRSLGLYAEAEKHLQRAVELLRKALGPHNLETLTAMNSLAAVLNQSGKPAEAEPLFRECLETRRRVLGPDHPSTLHSLHDLAWCLLYQDKFADAERMGRECLEAKIRVLGPEDRETLMTMHNLAQTLFRSGRLDEAETLHRKTLETRRRVLGPEHPHTLMSMNDLALTLQEQNKLDDAEELFRQTLEIGGRVWGPEHPETLIMTDNLGTLLQNRGKLAEAEPLREFVLDVRRRNLGEEHPNTMSALSSLASLRADQGQLDEAERLYRSELDMQRRILPKEDKQIATTLAVLGKTLTAKGQAQEAEPLLRESLAIRKKVLPADDWRIANAQSLLGGCLSALGRHDEADSLLVKGYDALKFRKGASRRFVREALERVIKHYDAWNKPEKVLEWKAKGDAPAKTIGESGH
jgi:serine/threonine protein kinase/Flp pilus assembly protein TadD